MKMKGVKLGIPSTVLIVFPRVDPESGEAFEIPFECKAVLDYADFDKLLPEPEPPKIRRPGDTKAVPNFDDKEYVKAVEAKAARRIDFMVLRALQENEIEWEKVNINDPSTWELWQEEMREAGFSDMEINRLVAAVASANSLNEETLEDARKNFLQRQVEAKQEK